LASHRVLHKSTKSKGVAKDDYQSTEVKLCDKCPAKFSVPLEPDMVRDLYPEDLVTQDSLL
jgi:hypothetical protein